MANFLKNLQPYIRMLRERIPERQVALAPADCFFILPTQIPENLPDEELHGFAELTLDGNSPFPLEQLAWGYLCHQNSKRILIFASPKARLRQRGFEDFDVFYHFFPGFLSLFGDTFNEPTIRILVQDTGMAALFYNANDPVPEKIISRKLNDPHLNDELLLHERDNLQSSLQTEGYSVENGLWRGTGIEILKNYDLVFHHRHVAKEHVQVPREHQLPAPEILWTADLRDAEFAKKTQNDRRRGHYLWKSMKFAAGTAILLLVAQLAVGVLSGINKWQQSRIFKQESIVNRIENKLTLAQRLTQSTEEDIRPFVLLEAVNPHRPEAVYFNEVSSRNFQELAVEGDSSKGVSPVNQFSNDLRSQGIINDVVEQSLQTRQGRTSFDFLIKFSRVPDIEISAPSVADEEEDDDDNNSENEGASS